MPSKAQIRPSARRFCAALGGRLERTKCWSGANEPAVAGTVRPALDRSATRKTHANALQLCGVRRVEASVDAQGGDAVAGVGNRRDQPMSCKDI
jgi:hypothetical protein